MKTTERRLAISDTIAVKRHTTIRELAREFDVSISTIKRDLDAIASFTSYFTTQGNGGGIHAAEGWYPYRHYFTLEQEDLLKRLSDGLQTDADRRIMKSILNAFSMPKHNKEGR